MFKCCENLFCKEWFDDGDDFFYGKYVVEEVRLGFLIVVE